jgi:hypothetical protein
VSTTVTTLHPSAADRLRFTPDGHADPAQLLDCLIDADTRNQSTGLVYLAEHTRAADLAPAARRLAAALADFPWCVSHRVDVCDDGTAYAECEGREVSVPAPPGMDTNGCELLSARLYFNENDVVAETLLGFGGSGEGTVLTAAEADQVIEHLETFVRQLRGMRAQMGAGR